MRILICDDKPEQAERAKQEIASRDESVESLDGDNLKQALSSFFLNSVSRVPDKNVDAESEFDGYDVLIVDNNLTELQLDGARVTAESIIGYLRAFSNTPYIISLNKNPHVDFDLRYLFGDYQSLADLALNTGHLPNRRLWGEKSQGDFAPWYWPRLKDAVERRRAQIAFIEKFFERPIWKELEFPDEAEEYLSLRAKSRFQASDERSMREVSFKDFFESSRTLPPGEIDELKKLSENEDGFARKAVCQILAYEIDRWLRRDVLGTQDVLIDLPHLVAQMPFLLGDKSNDLDHWNEVAENEEPAFGLDEHLFHAHLERARFSHKIWVPGPCFWWPSLKSDQALTELYLTAEGDGWPDAVFCEDVSRFVSVTGTENPPQEFEAEIDGSWIRRYVVCLQGKSYSPRSRILGRAS